MWFTASAPSAHGQACGLASTAAAAPKCTVPDAYNKGEGIQRPVDHCVEGLHDRQVSTAVTDDGEAPGADGLCETDIGALTLLWTGEAVEMGQGEAVQSVITLPQLRLMQLAMGYYGAETASALPDVRVTGERDLFCALFPRRLAYMWVSDHF